jgi:DNA repair protein RecO (recombination protein O)
MRDRVYTINALILRRRDVGEADRILVLGTPTGKRHVIARGVRKTTSRLAGHIELFTYTTMQLAIGRTFDVVTQSSVREQFPSIHSNLSYLSRAYYIAEIYDAWTQDGQEEQHELFSLLVHTFTMLDGVSAKGKDLVLRAYELQLLDTVGYRPHLYQCAICKELLSEQSNRFSPPLGGVLCPLHASADPSAYPMSFQAFKAMRYIQKEQFMAVERLNLSPAVSSEIETLQRAYLCHLLERDLRTVPFLKSLA